jgi:hypothetical protein
VHTDSQAGNLSNQFNARAFTVGEHIAFGAGEYQPGTLVGDALVAHELAHVVQQGGASSPQILPRGGAEYNALEEDADASAVGATISFWGKTKRLLTDISRTAMPRLRSGLRLQRCKTGTQNRVGKVKSGPTYSPNGTITPTTSGGTKSATFRMSAEFEHDPSKNIYASCCEVRQYMSWSTGESPPVHAGWQPASNFTAETWYEDRDANNKRYGHRTGPYSDPQSYDQYLDTAGHRDQANGHIYSGEDTPSASASRTGEWRFMLKVIDTCNANRDVGTLERVTIDL